MQTPCALDSDLILREFLGGVLLRFCKTTAGALEGSTSTPRGAHSNGVNRAYNFDHVFEPLAWKLEEVVKT